MARPNAANLIYKGRLLGYWQTFVTGAGSLGLPSRRLSVTYGGHELRNRVLTNGPGP
jgi:hypothetical protein